MAETTKPAETAREALRHAIAVVAYRGGKSLRGAPADFGEYKPSPSSRTPLQILAHINDLYDWAIWMAQGKWIWFNSTPGTWESEVARFFAALALLDKYVESDQVLGQPFEKFMSGPIADSLTHIGQINLLRRMAGSPVKGESYARAEIVSGRVGPEQAAANVEFD